MRYRVTGLASEAGFFALLSLPPLMLGLFGGLGYVANAIGPVRVDAVMHRRQRVRRSQFLTTDVITGHPAPDDRATSLATAAVRPASRWASCSRCGRGRGPSTSSSTPSRSCTASPACAASCRPGRCPSRSTSSPSAGRHRHHPAGAARTDPARRDPARRLGLADPPVLAAGHPAHRRGPHQPLPRLDADAGRPGCATPPAPVLTLVSLAAGLVTSCAAPSPPPSAATSIYGPLSAPDRAAHLALRPRDRRAHRCGGQRRVRELWPARGAAGLRERLPRLGRRARRAPHARGCGRPDGTTRSTTTVPGDDDDLGLPGCATRRAARSPRCPVRGDQRLDRTRAGRGPPPVRQTRRSPGRRRPLTRPAPGGHHRFGYRHGDRIMSASTPKGFAEPRRARM